MNQEAESSFVSFVKQELSKQIQEEIGDYVQTVATWLSKILLTEKQVRIIHDFDPPWDQSGTAIRTSEPFDIESYTDLESFVETEYTGNSTPSFVSGCGLFHDSFADELRELTDTWLNDRLHAIIESIVAVKHPSILSIITELNESESAYPYPYTLEDHLIDLIHEAYVVLDLHHHLISAVQQTSLIYLHRLGYERAVEEIQQANLDAEKKRIQKEKNTAAAKRSWDQLSRFHQLHYGEPIPHYIDMPYFKALILPILKASFSSEKDAQNIRYIGRYLAHFFSNSVAEKLVNFQSDD